MATAAHTAIATMPSARRGASSSSATVRSRAAMPTNSAASASPENDQVRLGSSERKVA